MKKKAAFLFTIILCFFINTDTMAADKVTVEIDPGHGGSGEDDAENGAKYADDLAEKDVNLVTSLALCDELQKYYNVEVYLTRDDDRKISLEDRARFAKSVDADVMVCCHYNASETHLFYGAEIFTSAFGDCFRVGNSLAQCIMKRWVEDEGLPSKGIKVRIGSRGNDYYGVIRHGCEMDLPVIIIEHGYLDNHLDYEKLGTKEDWERMGRLDARGIADYFGLSKDAPVDEVRVTQDVGSPVGRVEPDTTFPEDVSLKVSNFDIENSEVTYEVRAHESDGRLMYYGLALGNPDDLKPEDYADLMLWEDGKDKMTGTLSVPTGYRGKITARVYNTYELYNDSTPQEIDMASLLEEQAEQLEEEARLAAEEADLKRKQAEERTAAKQAAEAKPVEDVDDFFFFLGGKNGNEEVKSPEQRKRSLYTEVIALIILVVALICLLVIRHKKKIARYIRKMERDEFDRY